VYSVWAIYEQVCVAACDCGHLKLAEVPLCFTYCKTWPYHLQCYTVSTNTHLAFVADIFLSSSVSRTWRSVHQPLDYVFTTKLICLQYWHNSLACRGNGVLYLKTRGHMVFSTGVNL